MPKLKVNGAELYYEQQGSGAECILFAHGLLCSTRLFDRQVEALKGRYRCVSFDFRGQGQSEVTPSGYDMDSLAEDAAALIEALKCGPCHFVGLSMGGFIGMRLGIRHPELLRSLTLLETSADPEPPENVGKYKMMALVARWLGVGLVAKRVMPIMFGQKFMHDSARAGLREEWRQRFMNNHKAGVQRATLGVVNRQGVYEQLGKIKTPTLIMVGDQDVATVPLKSQRMHERIAGSKLVIIPGAGHTSTVEEPDFVNAELTAFLAANAAR
jgi:pimeloyl-ACP methyl ester carboxylesterase